MWKKTLWKDYLYEGRIRRIDYPSILKFVYEWKSECPGKVVSNMGGWQSHCYLNSGRKCNELDKVISIINKKFKYRHIKFGKKLIISELWININANGSYNTVHDHLGGPFLSGVLYLNARNDMGNIIFAKTHNIRFLYQTSEDKKMYISEHTPHTGKMLIFSASLPHFVETNNSLEDRVSLSFNLSYQNI